MLLSKEKEKKLESVINQLKVSDELLKKLPIDLLDRIIELSKCSTFEVNYYIKYCRNAQFS